MASKQRSVSMFIKWWTENNSTYLKREKSAEKVPVGIRSIDYRQFWWPIQTKSTTKWITSYAVAIFFHRTSTQAICTELNSLNGMKVYTFKLHNNCVNFCSDWNKKQTNKWFIINNNRFQANVGEAHYILRVQ